MQRYVRADDVRAAEQATGLLESGVLMARAARAVAGVAVEMLGRVYGARVALAVGAGGNGGDALYAGAYLARRGALVTAYPLAPQRTHAGGLAALRRAGGRVGDPADPAPADLVVDGVTGLSARGPLRPAAATLFERLTADHTRVLAVDIPSGIDADTGEVTGPAVHADVTVTFGERRFAHALAADHCGRLVVADIGLTVAPATADLVAATDADVRASWPRPGRVDDKYSQGVVGIVAGSTRYPGAGRLCCAGAVAATSGMVRYVGPSDVTAALPEVVVAPDLASAGRVQAWVVGPGIGVDDAAAALLRTVLATDLPVLVDADALTLLAADPVVLRARRAPTLLTPHAGEFERLTGTPPGERGARLAAVRASAADLGVHVLLKGATTLIAAPDGRAAVNLAPSAAPATAGSGDVLAGIIGALLAAGRDPLSAAALGARVHAAAADGASGGAPIGASLLAAAIHPTLADLLGAGARIRPATRDRRTP